MTLDLDLWVATYVDRVREALRAAITRLVEGLDPLEVAGLGAYTDADARSIVAAVLTAGHLTTAVAAAPELATYHRWSVGEWDRTTIDLVERGGPDDLAAVSVEADRVADRVGDGEAGAADVDTFRSVVWEAVVTALGQLFDEGFFDPFPAAIQVFDALDAGVEPRTLVAWTAAVNTDAAAAEFAAWAASDFA